MCLMVSFKTPLSDLRLLPPLQYPHSLFLLKSGVMAHHFCPRRFVAQPLYLRLRYVNGTQQKPLVVRYRHFPREEKNNCPFCCLLFCGDRAFSEVQGACLCILYFSFTLGRSGLKIYLKPMLKLYPVCDWLLLGFEFSGVSNHQSGYTDHSRASS